MSHVHPIEETSADQRRALAGYIIGFAWSIILTLAAYGATVGKWWSVRGIVLFISGMALTQFIIQVLCFLHLGNETKPKWKLGVFVMMIMIVGILVGGSIWIMNNLNYHPISPAELKTYLHANEGL